MYDLVNKVAIVTGAANGLGKAIAIELFTQGCHLALVDIDLNGLEKLKSELQQSTQVITIYKADVSLEQSVVDCRRSILRDHQHIDILVNNAGVSISRQFEELSMEDYNWLFAINFWGTVFFSKHILPELKKREEARLVNIISDFAVVGFPGKTAYASSKAAVMGFSNSLATELEGTPVKVSLVIPPPVDTDLVKNSRHTSAEKKAKETAFVKKKGMAPGKAAKKIVEGIKKGKYRIVIGRLMFWTDLGARLFPSRVHKLIGKNKKKFDFI